MHRSGTSLLADLLQHLGVELPGQLVNADHHNPQGYFEWQQIMELQERLLIDLNRWWPSAQGSLPMPPGWLDHGATRAAAAKLRCILQSTLPHLEAPCWAIKDPRTSRLLPMWLQVAEELHIPLHLLLAVRDPAEVMHSLVKRDGPITGMDARRAQALWWRFTLEPLQAAPANLAITRINYDDWFEQPGQQLQRLLAVLPGIAPSSEQCSSALQRIRPDHRHNRIDGRTTPGVLRRVRRLHQLLRRPEWEGPWPAADPPGQLNRRDDQPPPPRQLAANPKCWPAWLEQWQYHPAPRLAGQSSLASRARIKLNGMAFTQPAAHLWLRRLPISNIAASQILNNPGGTDELLLATPLGTIPPDGLERVTINLEFPPPDQVQQWLEQLRGEQAIWDPDPPRVCLMRALGLPAHWLDPDVAANAWLSQQVAIAPSSWSAQLGLAPPTEGALIVLGHAGVDWDKALAKESGEATIPHAASRLRPFSIDYRPGWFSLVTTTLDAALAQAGWLTAAAGKAYALIWIQAAAEESIPLLQADAIAQLLLEQPPLTPTKLRARLTPRPADALAEDRPSPHAQTLVEWRSEEPSRAAVIVSLFNYSDWVLDALNSVAQQRQHQLELIVVDDASCDDGAERVASWMQEQIAAAQHPFASLQLVRHAHNAGLATARNTAFKLAEADWCFVLDADNILYPDALSVCLAIAESGADALAVVHPIIAVEADPGMVDEHRSLVATASWQQEVLAQGNAVDAMALVRRSAWTIVGGYSHIEGGWEDYDFWCKLIAHGFHGVQCPMVLATYRSHANSMSATVTNSSWAPLRRTLQERHPWLRLT